MAHPEMTVPQTTDPVLEPEPMPPAPAEITVRVSEARAPRFTPRELRAVKEHLGRSFSQVLADEESDDKFVVIAWLKARRDGHDLSWAQMDDVVVQLVPDEDAPPPDPTNGSR